MFLNNRCPTRFDLVPLLFILYTKDMEKIALEYGFSIHMYADDTQLYLSFNPIGDLQNIESKVVDCLKHIKDWMTKNFLA